MWIAAVSLHLNDHGMAYVHAHVCVCAHIALASEPVGGSFGNPSVDLDVALAAIRELMPLGVCKLVACEANVLVATAIDRLERHLAEKMHVWD